MTVPSLNGTQIPTSMATRGKYRFERQTVGGFNGAGVPQAAGPQVLTWVFSYMTPAELDFFRTTLLAGALSVTLTAAELWDDVAASQTFTEGILLRPTVDLYTGGAHWGVTVTVTHLLPLLS
jgi:hypothetical protein